MTKKGETIVRFEDVSFGYGAKKPILDEVSFGVRRGTKFTLMGQNGAGKSTIFGLITKARTPEDGNIHIQKGLTVAVGRQTIPRDQSDLTVREFFQKSFTKKIHNLDPRIDAILEVVNLVAPREKIIRAFSGGQQARLLLASALIQDPDLLLLDEPTNNLDKEGIAHLTQYLIDYKKTVVVISHDAEFLNSFTEGVLYLDVNTHKIEQYVGNYFDATREITARVEKEQRKNAQYEKHIQEKKDKANFFANKGGRMRVLAKRMRESAAEAEESKVEVRKEDKTIRPFRISFQDGLSGQIVSISSLSVMRNHKLTEKKVKVSLRKNTHLLLTGPNGIGKSTLLQSIADGTANGVDISSDVRVGYYRQDFSNLDFNNTVFQELSSISSTDSEEEIRRVCAGLLISGDVFHSKIATLSEGQKGLVAFARLILLKPGLLILDEPTNHINFRHLPIIAQALSAFDGPMILVSHVPDFVDKIHIDEVLDLSS